MGIIDRIRARMRTKFININPHNCVACWKCMEACPKNVLGKIEFLGHRHVRISNGAACIGCKKCVRTCPEGCIRANE
ncbi:MAG: ferredoxin family protein [Bacteroidales bacterium]|nr:ferredoxin family protein [Bacteroidales bacterium]